MEYQWPLDSVVIGGLVEELLEVSSNGGPEDLAVKLIDGLVDRVLDYLMQAHADTHHGE